MNELLKTLLTISLTASVMILVVMGVRAMLAKRMNPAVIAALWAVVLLRLCVPITLESPVHVGDLIPEAPVVTEQTVEAEVPTVNVPQTDAVVNHTDIPTTVKNTILPQTEVVVQPKVVDMTQPTVWQRMVEIAESISLWSLLTAVWILGAVVVLGNTVRQGVKFQCRLKQCRQIKDGNMMRMVQELKRNLGIRQHVRVAVCNEIWAPAVFGCFRPVIILPIAFAQNVDKQTIRCILLHEMCHIKRRDILKSYVWLIAKALHWFNPLVWLAFRKTKDDIELCCDQMVIRHLDENSKFEYTQSLVDVFRISKRNAAYPVTVSLFENKAKLIERVMRMLKPNKRSKTALAVTILLTLLMTVTCFTTACQPVAQAEEPITVGDETKEQPKTEAKPELEETEDIPEVKEPAYDAPKHWTESITQDGSKLQINMDADIVVPEVDAFSVYEVEPNKPISQEIADRLIELFFGDTPLYKSKMSTRKELEYTIAVLQKEYAAMQDGTFDFSRCDIQEHNVDKDSFINETKRYIYQLENYLKDYREEELIPMDTVLTKDDRILGRADIGEAQRARIAINNDSRYTSTYFMNGWFYSTRPMGIKKEGALPGLTISKEEAVNRAKELLEQLGLTDYEVHSSFIARRYVCEYRMIYDNAYAYTLIFTKVVDGIPSAMDIAVSEYDEEMVSDQVQWLTPETIRVTIDDDGIRKFFWEIPAKTSETITKDAKLLPFDKVKDIIATYPFEKYDYVGCYDITDEDDPKYRVTNAFIKNVCVIRLEMARMPVDGNLEEQQLVPVWNVYVNSSEMHGQWKDKNGNVIPVVEQHDDAEIMLTINAIDGNVI